MNKENLAIGISQEREGIRLTTQKKTEELFPSIDSAIESKRAERRSHRLSVAVTLTASFSSLVTGAITSATAIRYDDRGEYAILGGALVAAGSVIFLLSDGQFRRSKIINE